MNGAEIPIKTTLSSSTLNQKIITFNATKLTSGKYFIKVIFNNKVETITFMKV